MNAIASISRLLSRSRVPFAVLFGFMALVLLWAGLGLSELLPRPGVAVAGSEPFDHRAAPLAVPKERAGLLQSSVDSVALSLGSAFADSAALDEESKKKILGSALSGLTFRLGGEVYFTAWQGTHMVHSPLSPDTAGMDFAEALDGRGAAFVRSMENIAFEGGFVQVTLPRQFVERGHGRMHDVRDKSVAESAIVAGTAGRPSGSAALRGTIKMHGDPLELSEVFPVEPEFCTLGPACGQALLCPENPVLARPEPAALSLAPVEQVAYVRNIPHSGWHIAAFMPIAPLPGGTEGFSAAWAPDNLEETAAESMFRRGLSLSGFSLAGLAGLMISPGIGRSGRKRDELSGESGG